MLKKVKQGEQVFNLHVYALPLWSNFEAITFGRVIIFDRKTKITNSLLTHELEHVMQYQKHGIVKYLYLYLKEYFSYRLAGFNKIESYYKISFEVEAYLAGKEKTTELIK